MPIDQDAFHDLWGTRGASEVVSSGATGTTRSVDEGDFAKRWGLYDENKPQVISSDQRNSDLTADNVVRSVARGIPVVGGAMDQFAATMDAVTHPVLGRGSNATTFAERRAENLNRERGLDRDFDDQHGVASAVGQTGGALGVLAPAAATAAGARAFGFVGNSLVERAALGGTTNALLNGADTAVRSGGNMDQAIQSAEFGAGIGAVAPFAGRAAGYVSNKLLSPVKDRVSNYLLQRAEDLGLPIFAGQTSTSPFINKLYQMTAKVPGSGMGKAIDEQHTSFNRAVARTFGEEADALTPEVMASAKRRIGSEFDAVAKNTPVKFDNHLGSSLGKIVDEASSVLEPNQVVPLAKRVTEIANLVKNGVIDGDAYLNMTKKGAPLSRLLDDADPNKRFYAGQIREALHDALERSATPEMAQRLSTARLQYKNMKTIEDLAEKAPSGDISPTLLLGQVRKSYPNFAYGAGGDLGDLARIGQKFMKQPTDSGTPIGTKALDLITHGAPAIAGAALGGGAAYHGGFDPATDIGVGLGGLLATAAAARGVGNVLLRPQVIENAVSRLPVYTPAIQNRLFESRAQ